LAETETKPTSSTPYLIRVRAARRIQGGAGPVGFPAGKA